MSSSLQGETECTTEVSDNSGLPEIAMENIPNDESSWLVDVDDGLVMESNSQRLRSSDVISKNTGEEFLVSCRMKYWKSMWLEKRLEVVYPVLGMHLTCCQSQNLMAFKKRFLVLFMMHSLL